MPDPPPGRTRRPYGARVRPTLAGVAVLLMWLPTAAAYLDPATGSLVWQILVSFFLGIAFAARVFWSKVKAFVGRLFGRPMATATPEAREHEP